MNNHIEQVTEEFDTVKGLVEHVLEKYEHTRSSDTSLFFQCCKELGATTLESAERLGLNVISVHKTRQVVQNRDGKFLPSEVTTKHRKNRESAVREYMVSSKQQGVLN